VAKRNLRLPGMEVFDQPTLWQRVRPMFSGFDVMLGLVVALLAVAGLITMYSAGFDHGTRFVDHARNMALAFGLVNTLVMAVFERVREIGLMLALGMTPGGIRSQILAESTLLLSIGLLLGDGLAWATIHPLAGGIDISIVGQGMEMFGAAAVLYPALRWQDIVLANVVVLLLGFIASLSPAVRASRYDPVEAITKV